MVKCLECGKAYRDDAQLHRHLKAHKLSQAKYYTKHFPRFDKFDGSPIIFKTKETYFDTDFNLRQHLKEWLLRVTPEEAQDYVRALLVARKNRKSLIYTLGQVELRTLMLPGMVYLNQLFGDYYAECSKLGFTNRFNQTKFSGIWKPFHKDHCVMVDTREQMPLNFPISTIHDGLSFADYQLNDSNFSHKLCVERKTISDLTNTMTAGHSRFVKEIQRAKDAGFYMVVVVEQSFEHLHNLSRLLRSLNIFISPEYVMHLVRDLIQSFDMLQFLFVDNREEASEVILRLFQSDGQFKHIDLQYAYDSLQLCGIVQRNI